MKSVRKNKQKQKSTLGQRIQEFYIQVRVLSEYQQVKINGLLINLLIVISTVQEFSFLLLNYNVDDTNDNISFSAVLKAICRAARLNFNSNTQYQQISYLIPLTLTLSYQFLLLLIFIRYYTYKQKKLADFLKQENRGLQLFLKIYAIYYSLQYYVMIIPIVEMTFDSVFQKGSNSNLNVLHLILSIFTLVLVICDYFIQLLCNLESISIYPKNLQFLQVTFMSYWCSLLNFLIIIVDALQVTSKTKFYLIFCLIMIRETNELWTYVWGFPNLYGRQVIILVCNIFQVTLGLILFVNYVSNTRLDYYETLLLFTVAPVLIEIMINKHSLSYEKIMKSNCARFTADMLQYRIANIIHEFGDLQQNYIKNPKEIITLHYFKKVHIEDCSDMKCQCQQNGLLTFEEIVVLHLKDSVKQFDNAIQRAKDDFLQQSYFLHYLSLVNYLGYNTKAFQQSNFLLQLESEEIQRNSSATSYIINFQGNTKKEDKKDIYSSSNSNRQTIHNQKSMDEKTPSQSLHLKLQQIGFIQKQKLVFLQERIKQSMSMGLQKQKSEFSENLEHAVKLFLQSEESNKKLRNKVIKMINRKREFFTNLNSFNTQISLFQTGKKLLVEMTTLEETLYKLYDQFPSQKMQALNTFYQSEIMNNYFAAYKIATIASISDEKLLKMQSQINFDLFSNKIDYLIIGFDQQTHKLSIRNSSNQINHFFGLQLDQFQMITTIEPLLPYSFGQVHEKLVSNFLQNGVSKFFRSINLNLCRYQTKFIKPVDFFYDINLINLDDLTFACFLQNNETQNAYIFCSMQYKIVGITKNLIHKLGYDPRFNKGLMQSYQKVPLNKVIPKINQLIGTNTKTSLDNFDLLETTQISEYQILMYAPQVGYLENEGKINWENTENLNQFNVDCVFHFKNLRYDLNYVIVEIKEIKKFHKTENTIPNSQTIKLDSNQCSEEFDDFEEEKDIEFAINFPKAIELYGVEDEIEDLNNIYNFDPFENVTNKLRMNDKKLQPNVNSSIVSPKDSGLRLIDQQQHPDFNLSNTRIVRTEKQQFFCANEQPGNEDYSSSFHDKTSEVKKNKEIENQIDKLQLDDIDKDLQENIKQQMQMDNKDQRIVHIDDIGSQVSSIAGLKKSKYSKKYDLIEKMLGSKKFSLNFKLVLLIFIVMLILFSIFAFLMLYFSNLDLQRFLQELDLIQIKSNIIGPVNKYIVSQNALTNYFVLMYYFPNLTISDIFMKMQYSQQEINYTYYELKNSFSNQLSNPYLNPFFEDKFFNIMVGSYPNVQNYSVSARESMYLYLEATYHFKNIDYTNLLLLDLTQPFIVFLFGNYQTFLDELKILNEEMLQYSIYRSQTVRNKWTFVLIPILIISFLLMLSSLYCYQLYLIQYNKFLQLFGLVDVVWLQRDIDRYRGIASLVMKDSDVLFKYQFDIEIKEKFLAAEDIRKEKIAQNQRNQKQQIKQTPQINQKMSILPSVLLFSIIFGVCFIFCFITNSQGRNYFEKYPASTTFFNKLSDLSIAISGVFAMRELAYIQKYPQGVLYFLSDRNATFFIETLFTEINIISDFLNQVSSFESSQYITSDTYVSQMELLLKTDVCQFLPAYKTNLAQAHCDAIYEGVLRRGFQSAAITFRDSILNEYSDTNQFALKTYTTAEQLEGGLIGYDAVSALKSIFQNQLISATNQLINQITIINLIFIGIQIVMGTVALTKIKSYFFWEFNIMRRFVLLLPQQSLFLDNQLDRILRQMIVKDNLI